ncbi:bestrophin family protein [Pseudomonas mangiferae]|uniref:Bestrophin n=1 Tax=Pseudomonas mangiferae TaxID=2593654 RepID=A0A553GVV4_9PSED|nr:bestrophin family ion channel [Pseudomonas mangiferae]TRX73644.1 bestrophin [Pseudomonas mangiferae]
MITRPQNPSVWVLLFSLKGSIIPVIWRKVLFTMFISTVVVATHGTLYHYKVVLTATPFTLWGLTLAIFLGFRNTVAYQRFWEARTLWGELLIVSRNLTRQLVSFMPGLARSERLALAHTLIGFGYALRDHLRREPSSDDVARLLDPEAAATLEGKQNLPNALLGLLGKRVVDRAQQAGTSDIVQVEMDQQLTRLSYVLAGCERIAYTPIPYPYILMLHRVVHIYCFLLPFCLVNSIGAFTPFAVGVLAYTFFGLDALGDQISDPFDTQPNDLPLNALCRTLEISVLELLEEPAPAPPQAEDGVLL